MFLSIDLKMANIVLGLQSHSASHPCHICDAKNPKKPGVDWEEGNLRTLGSIRDNVEKYRNSTDPKRAQVTESSCFINTRSHCQISLLTF